MNIIEIVHLFLDLLSRICLIFGNILFAKLLLTKEYKSRLAHIVALVTAICVVLVLVGLSIECFLLYLFWFLYFY